MKPENKTYVQLLVDSTKRKELLLQKILDYTTDQSRLLKEKVLDYEAFEEIMNHKAKIIEEIIEIDQGFDTVYKRVETALEQERERFKDEIIIMQKRITSITKLGVSIQALEKKNSTAFQLYLSNEKNKIREKRASSETASNYYKNMNHVSSATVSRFIDEKN
ncbi:MAG: hypothetical protein LBR68_03150 [Lachnoclostridium sp.]|jgi:RecJ-like exonuclease|nr:hypothetical protein [Lachnoclostridium sp.]